MEIANVEDRNLIGLSDKHACIICMATGAPIVTSTWIGDKKVLFFDRSKVKDVLELYHSNKPIPVKDIRDIFSAQSQWQTIIRWQEYDYGENAIPAHRK